MTKPQGHLSHQAWRHLPMRLCSINHWMTDMPHNVGDTIPSQLTVSFLHLLVYLFVYFYSSEALPFSPAPRMNFRGRTQQATMNKDTLRGQGNSCSLQREEDDHTQMGSPCLGVLQQKAHWPQIKIIQKNKCIYLKHARLLKITLLWKMWFSNYFYNIYIALCTINNLGTI